MQNLDDVLNGVESDLQEEEIQQGTGEPEGEKEPEQEADAEAKADEEAEKPEQGSPPEPEQPRHVPIDSLLDERRKRQEAENELEKYRQAKAKAPDVFEDQEGFTNHINQTISQQVLNATANISEFMAKREYPDLEEKVAKFQDMVKQNPSLQQQVLGAISPYHEIVDIVTKAEELEKMKDIDSYKAQIRAEVEAEIKARLESEQQAKDKKRQSIPPSLVSEPSKGTIKGTTFDGPSSLESILD